MRLEVLKQFHDKYTGECYKAGAEIEVSEKRGAELLSAAGNLVRGLEAEATAAVSTFNDEADAKEVPAFEKPKRTKKK